MRKLIGWGTFVLLLCASTVFAETWIQVGYDRKGDPIMLDTDSIKRSNGTALYNIKLPPVREGGEYAIVNSTMDCAGHSGRRWHKALEFTTWRQDGIQLDHWYNPKDEWQPVYPGSTAFTISDFVCPKRVQVTK